MTLDLKPRNGGFSRAFGAAQFILDFLRGQGPRYGADAIEPAAGAPQTDIHSAYKTALARVAAEERAAIREERDARREQRPIEPDRIEELTQQYIERPGRYSYMRYHSFLSYFAKLKALGWVEETGQTEASTLQDFYPEAPPRIYYRVTLAGETAPPDMVSNPLAALYGGNAGAVAAPPLPPEPPVARVEAARDPAAELQARWQAIADRINAYARPNSRAAEQSIDRFVQQAVEDDLAAEDDLDDLLSEVRQALEDY
ncbi:MAG: hypothetical protein Q8R28_03015, partial [Dehalococcoidia bacterium]|nr:hypothetical protein [Dehalococcoidia bacterium]